MNAGNSSSLARAFLAALVSTIATFGANPAAAQTPADLVVVPLTFPGDNAPFESAATSELLARLRAAGGNVTLAKTTDPFSLALGASKLCADSGANAIVTGRLRVEQTSTSGSLGYLPYIGTLAKALVNAHPSHAVAALDRIACDGHVLARATGDSDTMHYGQNVGAGVTVAVQSAVDQAVTRLVAAPDATAAGEAVWLQTGALPTTFGEAKTRSQARADDGVVFVPSVAATTAPNPKRIALTAVEDTLEPDAHEAFATSALLRHLQAHGYDAAEVAPLDRFEIAGRAAEICSTTGASRILASAVRYEQSAIDNLFGTSYPTHAFLHFDLLGCDGAVLHSEDVTSDIHYQFSNVGAAISKALDDGVVTGLRVLALTGEATAAR